MYRAYYDKEKNVWEIYNVYGVLMVTCKSKILAETIVATMNSRQR